ncbi:MAG: XdhC family protein [Pseudomonadota bacterium]
MKSQTLTDLNRARLDGQQAVLVTDVKNDRQSLVINSQWSGEINADVSLTQAAERALREDRARLVEHEGRSLFVQPFNPPLRLIIVGAVHISQVLVPMAALAGYAVTVVDPRRGFANDERFPDVTLMDEWPDDGLKSLSPDPRTAIVTLTHDPKLDDPALDVALMSNAFYVAALGSKRTHAARLERLAELGHDEEALARIHGPAGLPLGAVSPAEIALSVMAEMTQVLRRRDELS